jgi:hypothetical protein
LDRRAAPACTRLARCSQRIAASASPDCSATLFAQSCDHVVVSAGDKAGRTRNAAPKTACRLPALQRVTIDMPSGHISKLRLAAYLAQSSNTIQFGANLDVYLGVSDFGVSGHLGFDALLQLRPFRFDSDISGKVAITAGRGRGRHNPDDFFGGSRRPWFRLGQKIGRVHDERVID